MVAAVVAEAVAAAAVAVTATDTKSGLFCSIIAEMQ
jgi:hypothetical protein